MHELVYYMYDGGNPFAQCYTSGHVLKVEQEPFASAIPRYYLMAILSIGHDLSQKLDLETGVSYILSLVIHYVISYACAYVYVAKLAISHQYVFN